MEIILFDTLPSTQEYLIQQTKSGAISSPVAILAKSQTNGIGSRDNRWSSADGNLTVSILLTVDMLPNDLPLMSASIYFGALMKKVLDRLVDGVWLKWPNDLLLNDNKIGGIISKKIDDKIILGIGINLKNSKYNYASLSIDTQPLILLNMFIQELKLKPKWKDIFRQFKIEFDNRLSHSTHLGNEEIDIKNALINSDGSLSIGKRKVYSKR